ncbi:hypothetical protein CWI38_1028p0020 [Hamiltosporidium tvaerminnensis]|uniref:Uncharacterized protein n=1 Tax=Hamiltosporidium tvaerminnensis TaxID=1176355 RepID=A0A4Q9LT82_9MICR|nr:hypothetical protein CWI38_1028p0020 [Hamiltosporidium tvaerminnensis]
MISRQRRFFGKRLNRINIKAINRNAISLLNYHIRVLRLKPADFSKLDERVSEALVNYKLHLRPRCKERLYLPRKELGRSLHSVELRSKHMLQELINPTILKMENTNETNLAQKKRQKSKKSLEEAQLAKLYNEIEK